MRRDWFDGGWSVLIWELCVVLVHVGVYDRRSRCDSCRGKFWFCHSDVASTRVESKGSYAKGSSTTPVGCSVQGSSILGGSMVSVAIVVAMVRSLRGSREPGGKVEGDAVTVESWVVD